LNNIIDAMMILFMQPSLIKAAEESSSWKINIYYVWEGMPNPSDAIEAMIMLSSRLGKMSFLWPAAGGRA
jgi:hypothetical protein